MYKNPSLKSSCHILRLSLWLLFGCSICTNGLYAHEDDHIGETILMIFGEEQPLFREWIYAVSIGDKPQVVNVLRKLRAKLMRDGKFSKDLGDAFGALLDEENADGIYQWVHAHYLTSSQLVECLQKYVKELLGPFQLLPDLPANRDMLEAYLDRLPAEMNNRIADLKHRWGYTISKTSGLPFLQSIMLFGIQDALEKRVNYIEKLINSHPYFVQHTDQATYLKIADIVKHLEGDMKKFLGKTITSQQESTKKWEEGSLPYQAWAHASFLSQCIEEAYNKSGNNTLVPRSPFQEKLNALRCALYLAYKDSDMRHLEQKPPGCEEPPVYKNSSTNVQAGIPTREAPPETSNSSTKNLQESLLVPGSPPLDITPPLDEVPEFFPSSLPNNQKGLWGALLAGGLLWYEKVMSLLEGKGLVRSSNNSYDSLDSGELENSSSTRRSSKKKIRLTPKGVIGAALTLPLIAGAGYQLYKKYLAQGHKKIVVASNRTPSSQKWLFFILFLLLGGLLIFGTSTRKQRPLP